jgi:hypothetical protein
VSVPLDVDVFADVVFEVPPLMEVSPLGAGLTPLDVVGCVAPPVAPVVVGETALPLAPVEEALVVPLPCGPLSVAAVVAVLVGATVDAPSPFDEVEQAAADANRPNSEI